jgi:hypothetical protein
LYLQHPFAGRRPAHFAYHLTLNNGYDRPRQIETGSPLLRAAWCIVNGAAKSVGLLANFILLLKYRGAICRAFAVLRPNCCTNVAAG